MATYHCQRLETATVILRGGALVSNGSGRVWTENQADRCSGRVLFLPRTQVTRAVHAMGGFEIVGSLSGDHPSLNLLNRALGVMRTKASMQSKSVPSTPQRLPRPKVPAGLGAAHCAPREVIETQF